jgi:glyceraldehyde 3-phosphate dehydrogenase
MSIDVGINGFGRIGRLVFRMAMESPDVRVRGINDIAPLDNLVYLLRHDSVHHSPDTEVEADGDVLRWGDQEIPYSSAKRPADLPWRGLGVKLGIESTGLFTKREDASGHLDAGAERVLLTAPGKGDDVTLCLGVNGDDYDPDQHRIISNASCTTNCIAPVAQVLDASFRIVTGFLTTIHAYTSTQSLVDAPSKKWRRGRAAALSMIPTTTGAAVATTKVLPQLDGKLDGLAVRVPVPCGSILDFVAQTERELDVDVVNRSFRDAADSDALRGILAVSDEGLVSQDVIGTTYSALVDAASTMVLGDHTVKVLAWYDNEWAYARRVVEIAALIGARG